MQQGASLAKTQTEKCKYPSRYSPDEWVTAAQYIIELVCEKIAKKHGKDLPAKFWNLPEWETIFKSQLKQCHGLLRNYDERAVIRALNSKGAWSLYSLRAPYLIPMIQAEQRKLDAEKKKQPTTIQLPSSDDTMLPVTRTVRRKTGIIGKLKDLDEAIDGEESTES